MKGLCDKCKEKLTCTKLCDLAEKYARQDKPKRRPGHVQLIYIGNMDSFPALPEKNLNTDISKNKED